MSSNFICPRSAAYKAASESSTPQTREILRNFWIQEGLKPLDQRGDTILHFLAIYGNTVGFQAILQDDLVKNEDLKTKNIYGDTPLHEAARFGQRDVAKVMLMKERDLTLVVNNLGETPLYVAAARGKKDVFKLLLDFSSDYMTTRGDGCTILHAAVIGEQYSLALSILQCYTDLACIQDTKGMTALNVLATKVSSFKSISNYIFRDLGWKPLLYIQLYRAIAYTCVPAMYVESKCDHNDEEDPHDVSIGICKKERSSFTKAILGISWLKEIDEAKQRHTLACILAKRLIAKEDWNRYIHREQSSNKPTITDPLVQSTKKGGNELALELALEILKVHLKATENQDCITHYTHSEPASTSSNKPTITDPLIQATKNGIYELALEILKVHPEAAETIDENGRNLLHIAVEQKNRKLYSYLMEAVAHKDRMMTDVDNQLNTVMHFATIAGINSPPGILYQMMWDVYWFKRVQYDTYQHLWSVKNINGMTAREVFEINHADIRERAEKTTKEMANGLLIVSVLIGTISFAAIFTLPGGFDQSNGLPLLLKTQWQDVHFLLSYLGGALFSSVFAMGALLSILFSKFDTEDFYLALPLRHMVTFVAFLYATGFTFLACCEAYILEESLLKTSTTLVVLLFSCFFLAVIYVDMSYQMFDYMYHVIRYCLSYRRQPSEGSIVNLAQHDRD